MTARVFILEECALDTARAHRFGTQVILFDRTSSRSSIWDEEFKHEILAALSRYNYDPTRDYFVVVGHMVPIVIAATVIVGHYGGAKALFWSSTDRDYVPRQLGDTTYNATQRQNPVHKAADASCPGL